MPDIVTRRLEASDAAAVAELEARSFAEPWSENAVLMLTGPNAFGFVTLADGELAAYGGMVCVLDEGQITNIATDPDFRRLGLAERTLSALLAEAGERGLSFVTLEVRDSNVPARSLYEKLGFSSIGLRKNFYRKPTEDAVIMEKRF